MLKSTKKLLEKGNKNKVEKLKEHLVDAVSCMKDAKEEAKELVQIGMKALSKASSSKERLEKAFSPHGLEKGQAAAVAEF